MKEKQSGHFFILSSNIWVSLFHLTEINGGGSHTGIKASGFVALAKQEFKSMAQIIIIIIKKKCST